MQIAKNAIVQIANYVELVILFIIHLVFGVIKIVKQQVMAVNAKLVMKDIISLFIDVLNATQIAKHAQVYLLLVQVVTKEISYFQTNVTNVMLIVKHQVIIANVIIVMMDIIYQIYNA